MRPERPDDEPDEGRMGEPRAPRPKATPRDVIKPSWRVAALALAAGDTHAEAADKAGVNRVTVSGWMNEPAFVALVDREVEAALDVARRDLRRSGVLAVRTLSEVASDPDAPAAARVQASKEILNRIGLVEAAEVRHAAHDGGPLPIGQLAAMTPDQLRALREAASKAGS